jgi:predicted porin
MLNFNRSCLSVCVSFVLALSASSVNAATVYKTEDTSFDVGGRVQAYVNSKYASEDGEKGDINGKARLRLKGSSRVYEDISAIAFAEWDVAAETSENGKFNTRYAYVGFESETYGQLIFGQSETAMYNVQGKTDIFSDWGGAGNTYWDLGNSEYSVEAGRQEGIVSYYHTLNNFNFGATYQTAGMKDVNSGYAVSLGYDFDLAFPIGVGVAYDSYDLEGNFLDDRETIAGTIYGGTFGEGFYAAAMYNKTSYDKSEDKDGYEILASYTFDNSLLFMLSYERLEADDAVLVSDFVAEIGYDVTSNLRTYVVAEIGCGDIDTVDYLNRKIGTTGEASKSKFTATVQYNF